MSRPSNATPVMLWIPACPYLSERWLATRTVESIYRDSISVKIECASDTVELHYGSESDAKQAVELFVDAMSQSPYEKTKSTYPAAKRGFLTKGHPTR